MEGSSAKAAEWKHTNTLQLRGLPKTALPSDIRRVCANAQVENIQSSAWTLSYHFSGFSHFPSTVIVALDYQRFSPTGDAFITFNTPSPIRSAVQKLHGSMIAGHALAAGPSPEDAGGAFLRNRGGKGRTQAAQRGVVTGNGPNGAITDLGKSVVLYGLPGKMTEEGVSFFVRSFKLDGLSATKEKDVIKLGM